MHKHEVELTIESESDTPDEAAEPEAPGDADATEHLLSLVSSGAEGSPEPPAPQTAIPERIAGLVLGRVTSAQPLVVAWAGAPDGARVRSLVPVDASAIGRTVALMFENHDPALPVVTGLVEPLPVPSDGAPKEGEPGATRRVVVSSEDELVLRCGKASITLTKAGKILIRGAYVSSTASGTHRIRGGSVEIN